MRMDYTRARAGDALRPLRTLRTDVALGTLLAGDTLKPLRTDVALGTLLAGDALKPLRTGVALGTLRARNALLTLWTRVALLTLGSHRAHGHIEGVILFHVRAGRHR
jgi:hypothetical protein